VQDFKKAWLPQELNPEGMPLEYFFLEIPPHPLKGIVDT